MGKKSSPKDSGIAHPPAAVFQKERRKLCSFQRTNAARSDERTLYDRKEKEGREFLSTCMHQSDKVPLKEKGSGTPLLLDKREAILCKL